MNSFAGRLYRKHLPCAGIFALLVLSTPVVAHAASTSLFANGDFETGELPPFNSFFTRSSEMTAPSTWNIVSHDTLNPTWVDFFDHTHGDANGHFFVSNGSEASPEYAINIDVTLRRNTEYQLSGWVAAVSEDPPESLGIQIFNGIALITHGEFPIPSTPGVWQPFSIRFNSFHLDFASIFLYGEGDVGGNDFALDDISLTIPEPSAAMLFTLNLVGHAFVRRRTRCAPASA